MESVEWVLWVKYIFLYISVQDVWLVVWEDGWREGILACAGIHGLVSFIT